MRITVKAVLCLLLPVLLALFSIFRLAPYWSSPQTHRETIQYLEDRRTVVLELTGASTAASVAITLIPGDVGTPIAEKLADLSSAFLVIMSALVLEKYLVTLSGFVVFRFLIPVVCLLILLFFLLRRESFLQAGVRLFAFSMAFFLLVPVSVHLSRLIENTYQDLQVAVSSALEQDETDLLEDVSDASDASASSTADSVPGTASAAAQGAAQVAQSTADSAVQSSTEEMQSWWQRTLDQLTGRVGDAGAVVQEQIDRIREDVAGIAQEVTVAPEKLSRLLNHYIEVVSVLIVTSCVIPVLVFFVFYALVKLLFSLDMPPLTKLLGLTRLKP